MRLSTSWPSVLSARENGSALGDAREGIRKQPCIQEDREDTENEETDPLNRTESLDSERGHERPRCCEQVCLTAVYMAASTGMGVLMKFMFSSVTLLRSHDHVRIRGLPAPFLWTSAQQVVGFLLALVMVIVHTVSGGKLGYRPPVLDSAHEWAQVLILAFLFTLNIGLNNFSLSLVSLTVNNIIRATNPFWTACAAAILVGNKVPFEQWVLMCLGVAFAVMTVLLSGQDRLFSGGSFSVGVCLALCSILCGGITLVVVERLGHSASKLNALDSACYMTLPSGLLLLPCTLFFEHVVPNSWPTAKAGRWYTDVELFGLVETNPVWPLFVLSGLCAFTYNALQFLLVQRLSPVYTAFASNLSKAVTVVLSELYLETAATSAQCILVITSSFCVVVAFTCFSIFRVQSTIPGERGVVWKVRSEMRQREVRSTLLLVSLGMVAGILGGIALALCSKGLSPVISGSQPCNPVTFPQSQSTLVDGFDFGSLHSVVGRDGVLLITLESEPFRFQQAIEVLSSARILPTHFPATDKDCASSKELNLACWLEADAEVPESCRKRMKVGTGCVSKLEQAITDSHRRALIAALQRNNEWTAILEDDAAPVQPQSWDRHFGISWSQIPEHIKLVRLSWCSFSGTGEKVVKRTYKQSGVGEGFRLVWWTGNQEQVYSAGGCATGYIVHRSIIRKLLSLFPCCCAVDVCYEWQLFNSMIAPNVTWGMAYMMNMDVDHPVDESVPNTLSQHGVMIQKEH